MNIHALCNPSQGCEEIAGGLQLPGLRNPFLDRTCFFSVDDKAANAFGRGMRWVQVKSLLGQRLGFPPVGFYDRMSVLNQGIGQNSAGERIGFIERVGIAQQLNRFSGLPLREQVLAFGDKAVSFGVPPDAILGEFLQLGEFPIVGEFGGCAAQQL